VSKSPSADDLDESTRRSVERAARLMKFTWLDIPYYGAAVGVGAIAWATGADVLAAIGAGFAVAVLAAAYADARKTWRASEDVWVKVAEMLKERHAAQRIAELTMTCVILGPLTRWGAIDKAGQFRSGWALGRERAHAKALKLGPASPR
jgi:hypothetical protein